MGNLEGNKGHSLNSPSVTTKKVVKGGDMHKNTGHVVWKRGIPSKHAGWRLTCWNWKAREKTKWLERHSVAKRMRRTKRRKGSFKDLREGFR